MDEKVLFSALFDVYANLLTAKQREIAELYFLCDLSLGEIAEIKGISRQSVNDAVKTAKTELESYEAKLGFLQIKNQLLELAKGLDDSTCKRITEIVDS